MIESTLVTDRTFILFDLHRKQPALDFFPVSVSLPILTSALAYLAVRPLGLHVGAHFLWNGQSKVRKRSFPELLFH